MVYEIYGAENNVIVDVSFVNVRREYIFMLPLCYRVGKLLSDFMGFLIIDFPRLKGLYQMFPFWSAWDKVYSNSISAVS